MECWNIEIVANWCDLYPKIRIWEGILKQSNNEFCYQVLKKFKFEKEIKLIINNWIRISDVKLGWIDEFDKFVVNYANTIFIFDTFYSSSKLLNTFNGHISTIYSIDYSIFNNHQYICSGSSDKTIRIWCIDINKQIKLLNKHLHEIYCIKFSKYYNNIYDRNVICSSSFDKTIRFWDIKKKKQFKIFNKYNNGVCGIEFSSFNSGRYLCSGSYDNNIHLWDIETSKLLNIYNGHKNT
ncbi:hypothetical protein RFI_03388, partial [Reticulomyxa filosa]